MNGTPPHRIPSRPESEAGGRRRTIVALSCMALAWLLPSLGCAFNGPKYVLPAAVILTIKPEAVTLTVGRTMAFGHSTSDQAGVSWRVLDANGGSMDDKGNYQAPGVPGIYRVQVASRTEPQRKAVSKVTVVAAPEGPMVAPDMVESGASGLRANVPPGPGMTYAWSIEGGTLESGATTHEVRFSAGWDPKIVLRCRMVNAAGDALTLSQEIGKPSPISFRVHRSSVILTAGRSMGFGYDLSGGLKPSVVWSVPDPRHGRVDQRGKYTAPETPGTYTVRAMPDRAPEQAVTIEVNVVDPPVGTILALKRVEPGRSGLTAKVIARPELKREWKIQGGTISGATDGASITYRADQGPELILSCILTNEAGDSFTARRRVFVEMGP